MCPRARCPSTARPGDFLDYLKSQGIHAAPGDYLPRQVYGDYLRARFAEARAAAPPNVEFIHHRASAWQLRRSDDRWLLWLDDGTPLPADDVVLAFGNPPPSTPSELGARLVDRIVNCTGPECRATRFADPLVQSLLSSGIIRPDPLSPGIDIVQDGRPIARDGVPVDRLYYLGPWLRARDWEATAVPELREHAAALARSLAHRQLLESLRERR